MPLALAIRRSPLLTIALLVGLVKSIQFAVDSTALFSPDSGAFLFNALRIWFIPERSYVYGDLIRVFALPFHSLRAIVAMQMVMGGISAWLLGFALLRYFEVRSWIAIAAALSFAMDPMQIAHEHLIMTETAALLAMAVFLVMACSYFQSPRLWRLVSIGFAGIVLVSLRIVYLPPVLVSAVLLPLAAYRWSPEWPRVGNRRALALALAVSCGSTIFFHVGYRHLTGWLGGRESAYHFSTGFFLVSGIAPIVRVEDADDPRVARAVDEQNESPLPLADRRFRSDQLWAPQGFVARLRAAYSGDSRRANEAAQRLARAAIARNPAGFLKLGIYNYWNFWSQLRWVSGILPWEVGIAPGSLLAASDLEMVRSAFGADVSDNYRLKTPSRRFFLSSWPWLGFLLLSPALAGIGLWMRPRSKTGSLMAALFLVWSCLVLTAACLGGVAAAYRFLHPLSFTGIAGVAFLTEKLCRRV